MVHDLCAALVALGHDVTLFAADGSHGATRLLAQGPAVTDVEAERGRAAVPPGYPAAREATMLDAVAGEAASGRFDVVHCHTEFMHAVALRSMRARTLTTIHWRTDGLDRQHYLANMPGLPVAAISDAQGRDMPFAGSNGARRVGTVHHGIPEDRLRPGGGSRGDVAFLGRMTDQKGPDRAIAAARRAGLPVRLAGDIDIGNPRYFAERVEPLLDARTVYVGPVDEAAKQEHLGEAGVLAMPIDWPEPFGLVMIEAMATGTPVVATPFGAAPEVVEDGVTGFVVPEGDMPDALRAALRLDRAAVRRRFEERWTARRMAEDYAVLYRALLQDDPSSVAAHAP